ncbi:MAG: hypothetical protein HYR74_04720 [Candidatus Eisenbacteria bacterium]|nr:hypothetical protein [Candidatus Eisenbacteria bacterium]
MSGSTRTRGGRRMGHRRVWVGIVALLSVLGCQSKTSTPFGAPAESTHAMTTGGATMDTSRTHIAGDTPPPWNGITKHIYVVKSASASKKLCVTFSPPEMKGVDTGDSVVWISRLSPKDGSVRIDFTGTSPLVQQRHLDVEPGGSDGGIVGYDRKQNGNRTFYYRSLPADCLHTFGGGPDVIVDDGRVPGNPGGKH